MKRFYLYFLTMVVGLIAWPLVTAAQEGEPEPDLLKISLSRSDEDLREIVLDDGAVQIDFDGRFQSVSVARLNERGELEQSCFSNYDTMQNFMKNGLIQSRQRIEDK